MFQTRGAHIRSERVSPDMRGPCVGMKAGSVVLRGPSYKLSWQELMKEAYQKDLGSLG